MNNKYLSKKNIYADFFNSNIKNDIFEKQKNIFKEFCIETDIDRICLYYNKGSSEESFEDSFEESFEELFEKPFEESFKKSCEGHVKKPLKNPFELKIISIEKKV